MHDAIKRRLYVEFLWLFSSLYCILFGSRRTKSLLSLDNKMIGKTPIRTDLQTYCLLLLTAEFSSWCSLWPVCLPLFIRLFVCYSKIFLFSLNITCFGLSMSSWNLISQDWGRRMWILKSLWISLESRWHPPNMSNQKLCSTCKSSRNSFERKREA